MESKEFLERKEKWLQEVADGCHDIAMKDPSYPDFYVFQSLILGANPDLLILGANPAGGKTYKQALIEKSIEKGIDFRRRTKDDLVNGEYQYLAHPSKFLQPILEMFDEKILEKSVVMNSVYFNTPDISGFSKFKNDKKEMIGFCISKTKEFIYEICKPKTVLFIGLDSPKWMGINFNHKEDTVVGSKDGWLIQEKRLMGIRHFLIYHTSRNKKFNTGTNLDLKRDFFKMLFE